MADEHRSFAQREDSGWYARCSCGWWARYLSPVAARRDARAHRRHPEREIHGGLEHNSAPPVKARR
jgi:hypothetical protein